MGGGRQQGIGQDPLSFPSCLPRLERLQRIVSKLQMESGLCEEQLNQADTLLQSVSGRSAPAGAPGPRTRRRGARPGALPGSGSLVPFLQDIRLLNAGKAPQHLAEIERDLDKAEAMIRLLFNDVQALKDGRHPQGEQMYRRSVTLLPCPFPTWGPWESGAGAKEQTPLGA